jgi:LysR family hydrogen peroxide-inducible transcriptional activator
MEMHQLRYFAKVAELGNVTRAAEACFVSQPSLSQQINKLEAELGQPLLERAGRGIRLTEAGRAFKEYADQILALVDDARARLMDSADSGHLVVAAIPTVAPYFMPGVLKRFSAECPRANVELIEETTDRAVRLLLDGQADMAILALPVEEKNLHAEGLFREELVAALPEGHPLVKKEKVSLRDLASEPFVVLHEAHCLAGQTKSFCAGHGVAPAVSARIHQLETVKQLVRLGQGVSLVPAMAATDAAVGVVYRHLTGSKPGRTVAVAWAKTRFQTKLFRRFVAFLRVQGPSA